MPVLAFSRKRGGVDWCQTRKPIWSHGGLVNGGPLGGRLIEYERHHRCRDGEGAVFTESYRSVCLPRLCVSLGKMAILGMMFFDCFTDKILDAVKVGFDKGLVRLIAGDCCPHWQHQTFVQLGLIPAFESKRLTTIPPPLVSLVFYLPIRVDCDWDVTSFCKDCHDGFNILSFLRERYGIDASTDRALYSFPRWSQD